MNKYNAFVLFALPGNMKKIERNLIIDTAIVQIVINDKIYREAPMKLFPVLNYGQIRNPQFVLNCTKKIKKLRHIHSGFNINTNDKFRIVVNFPVKLSLSNQVKLKSAIEGDYNLIKKGIKRHFNLLSKKSPSFRWGMNC